MGRLIQGLVAGATGGLLGGVPSTLYGLATGGLLDPTFAAGSILLPGEERPGRLVAAAVAVHIVLSLGWGVVLAYALPRRHPAWEGAAAGLTIATVDLSMGRRLRPRVAALPPLPQVADHVVYGLAVGIVLGVQRVPRADTNERLPAPGPSSTGHVRPRNNRR